MAPNPGHAWVHPAPPVATHQAAGFGAPIAEAFCWLLRPAEAQSWAPTSWAAALLPLLPPGLGGALVARSSVQQQGQGKEVSAGYLLSECPFQVAGPPQAEPRPACVPQERDGTTSGDGRRLLGSTRGESARTEVPAGSKPRAGLRCRQHYRPRSPFGLACSAASTHRPRLSRLQAGPQTSLQPHPQLILPASTKVTPALAQTSASLRQPPHGGLP